MNVIRNSRYYRLNPTHLRSISISAAYSPVPSSGFPLIHPFFIPNSSKSHLLSNISTGFDSFLHSVFDSCSSGLSRNHSIRSCSTSVVFDDCSNIDCNDEIAKKSGDLGDDEVSPNLISLIIDIVKNDATDMETRLSSSGSNLSKWAINEVFSALNRLNVPALRFFNWARSVHGSYSRNADFCSLALDNCFRLGDFSASRTLLKDFDVRKISLSDKAFGFLNITDDSSESAKKSITEIVAILDEVGGCSRTSGIVSLITMLCSSNFLNLAKFVIEITEKKASYYNVLVKQICVNGNLKDAQDMISEMIRHKCEMNSTPYNYLISSLCVQKKLDQACKILKEMIERGYPPPTETTFEILIYFLCKHGRADDAMSLYDAMLSSDVKPRLPTHAAFVRGFVSGLHFDKAYKHVADAAAKDKWSATHGYNVLASLHIKHGHFLAANKLLLEMIAKGLNPKASVLRRAAKCLHQIGRSDVADVLDAHYSRIAKEKRC